MVTYKIHRLVFVLFLLSCKMSNTNSIIGNWMFCKDGVYFEMYINETSIYEFNEKVPILVERNYILADSTIFLNDMDTNVIDTLTIQFLNDNRLVIGKGEEKIQLIRMKGQITIPFYNKNKPDEIERIEQEFFKRANLTIKALNCIDKNKIETEGFLKN